MYIVQQLRCLLHRVKPKENFEKRSAFLKARHWQNYKRTQFQAP